MTKAYGIDQDILYHVGMYDCQIREKENNNEKFSFVRSVFW